MTKSLGRAVFTVSKRFRVRLERYIPDLVPPEVVRDLHRTRVRMLSTLSKRQRRAMRLAMQWSRVCVIMVNPSIASSERSDPTITKVVRFAALYGWMDVLIGNLFSLVSTDIRGLARHPYPVGAWNDDAIRQMVRESDGVLVAWGNTDKIPRLHRQRWREVAAICQEEGRVMLCLDTTSRGDPRHPLMVGYETPIRTWTPPE